MEQIKFGFMSNVWDSHFVFINKGCDHIFVMRNQDLNMGLYTMCRSHILYFLEPEDTQNSSPLV